MVDPTDAALAAMLFVGGILVIVASAQGRLPSPSFDATRARSPRSVSADQIAVRITLGIGLGSVVYMATFWPVAALYGAGAGAFAPTLLLAKRERRKAIDRVDAIAIWVETLRDTMAASAGLQEALRLSAGIAPEPIRDEVRDLTVRLQHESLTSALRRFAGDMQHPLSDMVVASLILASSRHAGSLRGTLDSTSMAARDTAAMWREVESKRASAFQQARLAGWISFSLMVFMTLTRRDFLTPFDSFTGQVALAIILGLFGSGTVVLYRMARPVERRRVFAGIEHWQTPGRRGADTHPKAVAS